VAWTWRVFAPPRLHLLPERPLYWGGSELVDLQIEMLRLAFAHGHTYAVLLSGQDYPLRNLDGLKQELGRRYNVWADVDPLFAPDGTSLVDRGPTPLHAPVGRGHQGTHPDLAPEVEPVGRQGRGPPRLRPGAARASLLRLLPDGPVVVG
jgi:hypothetical protein